MDITNRIIPKFATDKRDFSQELRKRVNEYFSKNNISTDEIDWSPYNVMKYKGNYVLVDV